MECIRFRTVFLLFFFSFLYLASSDTYLSNFKFEIPVIGYESLIKDFVMLNNDPKANIPDSFTVCSSVFIKFWSKARYAPAQTLDRQTLDTTNPRHNYLNM